MSLRKIQRGRLELTGIILFPIALLGLIHAVAFIHGRRLERESNGLDVISRPCLAQPRASARRDRDRPRDQSGPVQPLFMGRTARNGKSTEAELRRADSQCR